MKAYVRFRWSRACAKALFCLLGLSGSAAAVEELQFWHSMPGALGDAVNDLAQRFNGAQAEYKVTPVFKGVYQESMTAAIAAYRAGRAPHIVQVYDIATATMLASQGAVRPLHQLMQEAGEAFTAEDWFAPVRSYYADRSGKLVSLPFNVSTNVLYINQDAFVRAKLDPAKPPRTWKQFVDATERLRAAGHQCPATSSCPSCVHVENLAAWHNVPIATRANGLEGNDTELRINGALHVRHLGMLADMAKRGLLFYAGRLAEADARFFSGECAMLTSSSSAIGNIRRSARFAWSINFLPYHDDVAGAPQNMLVSGASLWALNGKSVSANRGVARFFAFVARAENQVAWHQATGYMPATHSAYALAQKSGLYSKFPGTDIPVRELLLKTPTENSRGVRFGNYVEVRRTIDEQLEALFAGKVSAQVAMDAAVQRGNQVLRRFEAAQK